MPWDINAYLDSDDDEPVFESKSVTKPSKRPGKAPVQGVQSIGKGASNAEIKPPVRFIKDPRVGGTHPPFNDSKIETRRIKPQSVTNLREGFIAPLYANIAKNDMDDPRIRKAVRGLWSGRTTNAKKPPPMPKAISDSDAVRSIKTATKKGKGSNWGSVS